MNKNLIAFHPGDVCLATTLPFGYCRNQSTRLVTAFFISKNKDRILNHFGLPFLFNRVYEMTSFFKGCYIDSHGWCSRYSFKKVRGMLRVLVLRASISRPRPKCNHLERDTIRHDWLSHPSQP